MDSTDDERCLGPQDTVDLSSSPCSLFPGEISVQKEFLSMHDLLSFFFLALVPISTKNARRKEQIPGAPSFTSLPGQGSGVRGVVAAPGSKGGKNDFLSPR